jgi:hypothetical protein
MTLPITAMPAGLGGKQRRLLSCIDATNSEDQDTCSSGDLGKPLAANLGTTSGLACCLERWSGKGRGEFPGIYKDVTKFPAVDTGAMASGEFAMLRSQG